MRISLGRIVCLRHSLSSTLLLGMDKWVLYLHMNQSAAHLEGFGIHCNLAIGFIVF